MSRAQAGQNRRRGPSPSRPGTSPGLSRRKLLAALGATAGGLFARGARAGDPPAGTLRFLKVRHATFLLELEGILALTDPWLRRAPGGPLVLDAPKPALGPQALSQAELLLITADTWDRFDPFSLRELTTREPYCFVPAESCARSLRSAGYRRVRVTRPGDRWVVNDTLVEVSPAQSSVTGSAAVGYRLERQGRSVWHAGPLAPLDVDDAPGRWIRERPTELVLTGYDPGAGARLGTALGRADAVLLGRLARARYVVPQGDEVLPAALWRAAVDLVLPGAQGGAMGQGGAEGGARVVQAERGRWYRLARP